ncbi:hypothetical protein CVT24_011322 [Panaeolus cyanescens]|uniref:Uncharacterized protein n=1 Tax=Panaeolus cyanescens TaxID=181874 RepID=A0A409YV53_9AGAR|nr:hypothetical protein CVT24_011322 [Panaeolus cyanescens]
MKQPTTKAQKTTAKATATSSKQSRKSKAAPLVVPIAEPVEEQQDDSTLETRNTNGLLDIALEEFERSKRSGKDGDIVMDVETVSGGVNVPIAEETPKVHGYREYVSISSATQQSQVKSLKRDPSVMPTNIGTSISTCMKDKSCGHYMYLNASDFCLACEEDSIRLRPATWGTTGKDNVHARGPVHLETQCRQCGDYIPHTCSMF